jgi:hypothetical protein
MTVTPSNSSWAFLGRSPPPKGLHQSYDLATLLKSAFHEREIDEVGKKRIGGDKQVSAGNENAESALREV